MAHSLKLLINSNSVDKFNWEQLQTEPLSYKVTFCVRGEGDKNQRMLEPIASKLVAATEAIAKDEASLLLGRDESHFFRYFPVIITTATLKICLFDPSDVSLEDGMIAEEKAEFETVPYVRFSKSFDASAIPEEPGIIRYYDKLAGGVAQSGRSRKDLASRVHDNERTVFVINALAVEDFLSAWGN